MGKAAKWFRGLLGFKKPDSSSPQPPPSKENRRWSFVKSYREKDDTHQHHRQFLHQQSASKLGGSEIRVPAGDADSTKRIATTAAVRQTSRRRYGGGICGARAAVKIQSAFRGYLARKALRALRGLVRLQALVRGHIERKRTTEWLRRMQVLLRAQERARAGRSRAVLDSSHLRSKSLQAYYLDSATPEKSEQLIRVKSRKYDQLSMQKRNSSNLGVQPGDHDRTLFERNTSDRYANEQSQDRQGFHTISDDQRSDKILEIDTGYKQHFTNKSRNQFLSSQHAADQYSHSYTASKDSTSHRTVPSPSSGEVQSLRQLKVPRECEDDPFCTADNSPQFYSTSSRGGSSRRSPLTPSKSDGSRSFLSGYSDHPNYMSYTESSKAKARSLSAPKQRPHFDRSGSSKRNSIHGYGESRSGSLQKVSGLHANFTNKAYPGSGRLDRLGMPVGLRC